MDAYERYYRRSYNAIDRLIEVYRNGYNKENTLKFRQELISKYSSNPKVVQSEVNNIAFTMLIALLGLNKEAIERTGKIIEYKKNNHEVDLSMFNFTNEQKLRLKQFNDSKVVSTDFDKWLSIKINPNTDKTNIDYLKRIRNSLLHSNFYIDEDELNLPFAQLKTKSYYESELFILQFQMFIFEYFSNIDSLGLSESIYTFDVPKKQIKNQVDLFYYFMRTEINKITYKNLKTVGIESPEFYLKKFTDENAFVDSQKFNEKLNELDCLDDLKKEIIKLTPQNMATLIAYLEMLFGENFYELDANTQGGIISTILKYDLDPKTEISNWISHFWYLYTSFNNPQFNMSFFEGDEFGFTSCYPALMVLKSYLLMYRLQNNNFDEIDYSKVDFDPNDSEICMYSETKDGVIEEEDYFKNSFEKEKNKGILTSDKEIWNKIICEVIRDSLAHGNVRTYISPKTLKPEIELRDIDPKKGTVRAVLFSLSRYEKFLKSEAFTPSNCYKKEDNKTLMKK